MGGAVPTEAKPPLRIYQPRGKTSLALGLPRWGPRGSKTLLLGIEWKFSPWSIMKSRLTKHFPLSWAERPPHDDGRTGGHVGAPGGPRASTRDSSRAGGTQPPGPHLLGAAWPNKPSLFGVTFDAVPTGSHTSPNPAKICAKLNQSILEMALVRFCQRDRLQGTKRSGGAIRMWGLGGAELSPSKPPTASGRAAGTCTVTVTVTVTSEAHGSLLQDGRGEGAGVSG